MFGIFKGPRPDITPAMSGGFLLGGVPVIANLLRAFGVFDGSPEQEEALQQTIQWGVVGGLGLILGDTGLRAARNATDAKVQAAALAPVPPPAQGAAGAPVEPPLGLDVPGEEDLDDLELPSDEEEFASPPPDETNMPVQESQLREPSP